MARYPVAADRHDKVFGTLPVTLQDGGAVVVDARGLTQLTIITAALATATVSRVDAEGAAAHEAGAASQFTVAPETRSVTARDWPFYRVSVAGGPCRVCCT